MAKTALIIGSNGFAGSYLYNELLNNGYEVYGVDVFEDKAKKNTFVVDMLDFKACSEVFEKVMPDYVFNLAGQAAPSVSWENINLTMHLNVDISVNIALSVAKCCPKAKILFIGSANQYDISASSDGLISEDCPLNGTSPYDVSKNTQEVLIKLIADRYNLEYIFTRSFNHIGRGQKTGFVITDYSKRIADLERGLIDTFSFGNLNSWRDFSDVKDVVRAYRLLAEKGTSGKIYNVGSGNSFYIRDLIGVLVENSSAAKEKVLLPERLNDDELVHVRADISELKKDTGFEPECDISKTLLEVLEYFRGLN